MSESFPIAPDSRVRVSTATAKQVEFSVPFPFQRREDITVLRRRDGVEELLQRGPDYTVAGAGNPAGGAITLTKPAKAGDVLVRLGLAPLDRATSIVRGGRFASEAIDTDIDRWVLIAQELRRDIDRAPKVKLGETAGPVTPGAPGEFALWAEGGVLTGGPQGGDIAAAQGHAEVAAAAAGAASADAAAIAAGLETLEGVEARFQDLEAAVAALAAAVAEIEGFDPVEQVAELWAAVDDPWRQVPVGMWVMLSDDLDGVAPPPIDNPDYRYVRLTAGEDGEAGYNEGALDNEVVSGSGADIIATSEIVLDGSPLLGGTVRLVNTTRELPRPGEAGLVQMDAIREHLHVGTTDNRGMSHNHGNTTNPFGSSGGSVRLIRGNGTNTSTISTNSNNPSHNHDFETDLTGEEETRPRNVGVTVYLRVA